MDIEHGNESFVCNLCESNSNNVKKIKQHMIKHVFQPHMSSDHDIDINGATESNDSLIEEEPIVFVKETVKLIKDWRDNYDAGGNPIDEDTDDDSTEDDDSLKEE